MKNLLWLLYKISIIATVVFSAENSCSAGNGTDSLVLFSDLRYHSEFEREALSNFVHQRKDTFNLFLAVDENMTAEEADRIHNTYLNIYDELNEKKIDSKKINKKIKIAYTGIHDHFLTKYNSNEYFPVMFGTGIYNCVSASMLFSLVFDRLEIPYKVMASSEHVYLIANPGKNSVVVETTNPDFEKTIFTGEFKQQYVYYLRSSKLISESDYQNKSVEEIFEEKFNQVHEAESYNLPGFQYYNKAIARLLDDDKEEAYELCQKAYFFYPEQQVKTLLYTSLLLQIEQCQFDNISDIDYLAQLLRFENAELNTVAGLFSNIILRNLQYIGKEAYCDSLFTRLASRVTDKTSLEEISFTYYMLMSYNYQNTDKVENYVVNALKIRGNHNDANAIMENHIRRKLNSIDNSFALMDSVMLLKSKYNFEHLQTVLNEYQTIANLKIACDLFMQKNIKSGESYLQQFEDTCIPPVTDHYVRSWIENAYRLYAVHYFYRNNKAKAWNFVNRGLKYAPDSKLLKSAVY